MARRRAGPAARGRDRRRPRDGHGVTPAVAASPAPGDPRRRRRRSDPGAGRAPAPPPDLPGVPPPRPRPGRAARPPLRRPPRARRLARVQRAGLPRRPRPLRRRTGRVPRLAAAPLRRPRPAQPRLGHRVLVPALRRLGRDRHPAPHRPGHPPEPDPAARLRPLLLRRPARPPARGAGPAARAHPGRARDHQLHGDGRDQRHGLRDLGVRGRRRRQRPLRVPRPGRPRRAVVLGQPHRQPRLRAPVVADGALDVGGELAAGQPRQAPRGARPRRAHPPRARGRRALLLPVAPVRGGRGEVLPTRPRGTSPGCPR